MLWYRLHLIYLLKEIRNIDENVENWLISDIPLSEAYAAAYAIKAKEVKINYWLIENDFS